LVGKPKRKRPYRELDIEGRIILVLKQILLFFIESSLWGCGLDSAGSGFCPVVEYYEHD
jgi:hypothetical protein